MTWALRLTQKGRRSVIAKSSEIWVYLAASPLLHLTMTLTAYLVSSTCFRKSGQKAIFNPVLMAIVLLVVIPARDQHFIRNLFREASGFYVFLSRYGGIGRTALPPARPCRRSPTAILVSLLAGSVTAV